jgi:hypothetical protein
MLDNFCNRDIAPKTSRAPTDLNECNGGYYVNLSFSPPAKRIALYAALAESYRNILATYFPHDNAKETKSDGEPEVQCCVDLCCSLREVDTMPNNHNGQQKNDHLTRWPNGRMHNFNWQSRHILFFQCYRSRDDARTVHFRGDRQCVTPIIQISS